MSNQNTTFKKHYKQMPNNKDNGHNNGQKGLCSFTFLFFSFMVLCLYLMSCDLFLVFELCLHRAHRPIAETIVHKF